MVHTLLRITVRTTTLPRTLLVGLVERRTGEPNTLSIHPFRGRKQGGSDRGTLEQVTTEVEVTENEITEASN